MNRKKLTIGIVGLVCIVAIVFVICRTESGNQDTSGEIATNTASDTKKNADNKKEEKKVDAATADNKTSEEEIDGKNTENTDSANEKDSTEESEKEEGISFPYQIPDTDLEVQSLSGYKGIYVEDGTDEEVKKVATILVKNNSKQVVEYGTISMQAGDKTLEFTFSALPAGKSCIVMEKNKTAYSKKWNLQYKESNFAYTEKMSKLESDVSIKTEGNGIIIKNKTNKLIPRIRIFYKYQLDSGEYVGGITYTCVIDDLESGESRTIYPSHFSSEGSVVMMVRRYEEKED